MTSKKKKELSVKPERMDIKEGRYLIIAGEQRGVCQAVVYLGTKRLYAETGERVEDALRAARAYLERRNEKLRRAREDGVPTAQEYSEALTSCGGQLSPTVARLLLLHSNLPERRATMQELATRVGIGEPGVAASYAQLGRKLGTLLAFEPTVPVVKRPLRPLLVFSDVEQSSAEEEPVVTLRPQFAKAFAEFSEAKKEFSAQSEKG